MTIDQRFLLDLKKGEIGSYQAFARANGVSVAYVRQLAHELAHKGYIGNVSESCGPDNCDGCPLSGGCALTPYDIWELTDKGRRFLEEESSRR